MQVHEPGVNSLERLADPLGFVDRLGPLLRPCRFAPLATHPLAFACGVGAAPRCGLPNRCVTIAWQPRA